MAKKEFIAAMPEELATLVDRAIETSVGYYDSKLSLERKSVLDYYNGILPKPLHAGNSKYISMDVYDSVESLKAVLLETFASGNKIVDFTPQTEDDVEDARIATEYCDYVVFRKNNGYKIFSDVIQDGLTARVGVAKVYWEEEIESVEEEFSNLLLEEVDTLISAPDVDNVEMELDEDSGLYKGTLTRKVDKSKVDIDPIPPEEFLITPQATSIQDAPFVAHRTAKTISELLEMGFDKSKVMSIGSGDDDELKTNPEVLARFEQVGADALNLNGELQDQSREVIVYECYLYLDMEGEGETKLWKVTKCGGTVLDYERCDKKPFVAYVPLPIPHSFYGSNFASKSIPTQNARTTLVRGILDHTLITNNPRMMVVKGALTNPKELIENRIGGLVNVTRPDGIMPLPQPGLNPFVFQTIQLLDEDKEEATGVSKLSQGLNKDAVSKQNSQAMVENLVTLSQQREKIMARNFAYQFVKELYLEVYRLAVANEKKEKMLRLSGNFVRVNPSVWADRADVTIELKLGYGEKEAEAQKYVAFHQMMSMDPTMGPMYSAKNKYNVIRSILDLNGVKNVNDFITPPEQIPPPQPDPKEMKLMELQERQVATQEVIANAQKDKHTTNAELEGMRIELDRMKFEFDTMIKKQAQDLREFEVTSKAAIAVEEITIAKNAPVENVKPIISPN